MVELYKIEGLEGMVIENIYVRGDMLEIELDTGIEVKCRCGQGFWGTNIADSAKVVGRAISSITSCVAGEGGIFNIININNISIAYAETNFVSITRNSIINTIERI